MAWLERKETKSGRRTWYVRFWKPDGSKGSKALGVGLTKREAQQLMLDFERKQALVAAGLVTPDTMDCSLNEFVKMHHTFSKANKAESTVLRDDNTLRNLMTFAGSKIQVKEINRWIIDDYVAHRLERVKPGTVNLEIRHLKAAFNQAVRWDLIGDNPFKGVKQIRIPQSDVPKFLDQGQIEQLLAVMVSDPLLPLVRFYLFTGARLREGVYLRGDDLDFDRKIILFRGRWTKSKRNRILPFGQLPELESLLLGQSPKQDFPVFHSVKGSDTMWNIHWVGHRISEMFNRIGIPWATTHTLRHTFASHLVMQGVELFTVSRLLGHSSVTITERHYAHLAPGHAERAIAKLPYR